MKKMTAEWIGKAEDDFIGSRQLAASKDRLHDLVCFHCQQSAEKYLKAILEEAGQTVPKTHDLENLLNLLMPVHASLGRLRRGIRFLTGFAVHPRYPLNDATKRQATAAIRWAERIRQECRALLGIKPPRKRKS
jgi:HEPN domain-containing protein